MDIDGLGEKQVSLFMDPGSVKTAGDFYRITAEQIAELDGLRPDLRRQAGRAIEASKQRPFGRVLFAIGIEGVGYVTGRNLAQQFRTVDALLAASAEEIEETPGIGPIVAELIHDQLADRAMRELIEDLRELGLRFEEEGAPPGEGTALRQDARAHRHAARPDPRAGDRADRRRGRRVTRRSRRRPTTSSPARARARSSRRPSGSAWRCSTRPACWRCSTRARLSAPRPSPAVAAIACSVAVLRARALAGCDVVQHHREDDRVALARDA